MSGVGSEESAGWLVEMSSRGSCKGKSMVGPIEAAAFATL